MMVRALALLLSITALSVVANPVGLQSRAAPDNTVLVSSASNYCMIMPRYVQRLSVHHRSFSRLSVIRTLTSATPNILEVNNTMRPYGYDHRLKLVLIGMQSYCSASARTSSTQGLLPANFWSNMAFKTGNGKTGKRYAQRMYRFILASRLS
jgi:hypothetical protein